MVREIFRTPVAMQDLVKVSFHEWKYKYVLLTPLIDKEKFDDIWMILKRDCSKCNLLKAPVQSIGVLLP